MFLRYKPRMTARISQTVRFSANQVALSIGLIARIRNKIPYIPNNQGSTFDDVFIILL